MRCWVRPWKCKKPRFLDAPSSKRLKASFVSNCTNKSCISFHFWCYCQDACQLLVRQPSQESGQVTLRYKRVTRDKEIPTCRWNDWWTRTTSNDLSWITTFNYKIHQSRSLHNPGKNNSPWTIKVGCAVPQSLPHGSQLFQCSQEANWSNMGKEHFVPWLETARLLQSSGVMSRLRLWDWGRCQSRLIAPSFSKSSPSHRSPELNHNLQKSDPKRNETPKHQLQTEHGFHFIQHSFRYSIIHILGIKNGGPENEKVWKGCFKNHFPKKSFFTCGRL